MVQGHDREVSRRTDGEKTKAKIITEAMKLTAERGYNGVTSKEICEASGVNTALVSYYFGSRKQLHLEVLKRAHDQLFSMEEMQRIAELPVSAEERLKVFLNHIYKREKNSETLQAVKIFLWEIRNQSDALKPTIQNTILPKLAILLQVCAQISGLPIESPELRKTMFFVLAPCILAVMFPTVIISTLFNIGETSSDSFVDMVWKRTISTLKKEGAEVQRKSGSIAKESEIDKNGEGMQQEDPLIANLL